MTISTDTWKEQNHFRRDAARGSAKLLKALVRYHHRLAKGLPRERTPRPSKAPPRCGRILAIQNAVAEYYGISKGSFLSRRKSWHLSHPRQIAMYLARVDVGASFPLIGQHFKRDHTTVLYACREVEADVTLSRDIGEIRKMLVLPEDQERMAA